MLRELGFELVPIALPKDYPLDAITLMLGTEAAAVFDEFTRNHVTEGLRSSKVQEQRALSAASGLRTFIIDTGCLKSQN